VHPVAVGSIVFICTFAGALLGMRLRTVLPEHHFDADSRDTMKLGIGLIATMTALVLGLVTASAQSSVDAVDTAVKHTATQVLVLDRTLARYGSETSQIRTSFQRLVGARIDMIWPQGSAQPVSLDPMRSGAVPGAEGVAHAIRGLQPRDGSQRALQARALDLTEALLQTRWLMVAGTGTSVPLLFLVVLLFWLTITFSSFGLYAPLGASRALTLACAPAITRSSRPADSPASPRRGSPARCLPHARWPR
jgi:hypothetical protein